MKSLFKVISAGIVICRLLTISAVCSELSLDETVSYINSTLADSNPKQWISMGTPSDPNSSIEVVYENYSIDVTTTGRLRISFTYESPTRGVRDREDSVSAWIELNSDDLCIVPYRETIQGESDSERSNPPPDWSLNSSVIAYRMNGDDYYYLVPCKRDSNRMLKAFRHLLAQTKAERASPF